MKAYKPSALYRHIERLQGDRPWGALLDAGTGANSIRWIESLPTDRWTAVTGSTGEAALAQNALHTPPRTQDRLLVGNWADPALLHGETFDTVIADYLLGAMDGFAPYFQPYLFPRLRPLTKRTLYVTGLEPYVPTTRPETKAGQIIWELGRFRDACILMKGDMPYREYPAQWAADQITKAGFCIREIKHFTIGFKDAFVTAQLDIALSGLERLPDPALVSALQARAEALRSQALDLLRQDSALRHCRNYVIAAEVE